MKTVHEYFTNAPAVQVHEFCVRKLILQRKNKRFALKKAPPFAKTHYSRIRVTFEDGLPRKFEKIQNARKNAKN